MSKELILDTTAKYLVVGLASEDKVLDTIQYIAWQRQSEFAIQEVENILKKNNTSVKEITRIVVTNGPGSYTGIRIALTIAKVFALALDIKICVVSSLQAIAGANGKKIALLDARSQRAYYGIYNNGIKEVNDSVDTIENIKELVKKYKDYEIVGDTSLLGYDNKEIDFVKNMFELGKIVKDCTDSDSLVPVYLKEAL